MKVASNYLCVSLLAIMPVIAQANVDPTAPLGYHAPTKVQKKTTVRLPALDAIMCSSEDVCTAVLDGESAVEGQTVRGFAISAINENRVLLKRGNKRWSLTIFNEQVVQ
ncbi:MSHA biogenesis protein MshK [Enterovibrio coralii]|uniref:MSHA biogenesis protein MshK n=1 Tax=Enterovibrio coralii TaxID=294935 RepID=A0A135I3M2_9GAMM|nr:MSHA biogenesis protein MshK [Enterovibrio coralii]KXF80025.1 MSHA biogenesis protein MshK [Enterovibrio coralii]